MCGIVGQFGTKPVQPDIIRLMNNQLVHRGPDSSGEFFCSNGGMAMRRLSIIDLTNGDQPLSNEDGQIQIIGNGEIYNHNALRKNLKQQGHTFKTHSDIEIIAHLYEESGPKAFAQLRGMYAIALYDQNLQQLFLVRDPLGKKPLYWSHEANQIIFASELKALLQHPDINKTLDHESLYKYLIFEYVPTPYSIFKNISKCLPGSYIQYDIQKNTLTHHSFWQPTFTPKNNNDTQKTIAEFDSLLQNSVAQRLVADVPVGIFLSGGIDSSTIAYYAQKQSAKPIETFSISFDDQSFDESEHARSVATHLKTNHHEQLLKPNDLLSMIPTLSTLMDEPLADASIVPTFLLSQFTKEHVTVALSGDGADELLMGYQTFQAELFSGLYQYIPKWLRHNSIEAVINALPTSMNNMSFDFRLKRFLLSQNEQTAIRHQHWIGSFTQQDALAVLHPDIQQNLKNASPYESITTIAAKYNTSETKLSKWDALLHQYQRSYLMDNCLVKVDRASMMNSLEVRSPFMDIDVVDFINHLKSNLKMHHLQSKYLLKQLMKNRLPDSILQRKKKGFGIPVAKWINGSLKELFHETLSPERLQNDGIFQKEIVQQYLKEHHDQKKDHRKILWTLFIFHLWLDTYGKV